MVTEVSAGAAAGVSTFAVTVTTPPVAEAVIVAVPPATAVTRPVELTLAVPGAEELHVTVAATAAPFWSFGFAVSCVVPPMASAVDGAVIVTVVSTGVTTVMRAVPVTVTPPVVALAVMVAVPPATPVTRPLLLTLAVADEDELHVTVAAIAAPCWSFGLAVSWIVPPIVSAPPTVVTATVVSTGAAVTVIVIGPVTTVVPDGAVAVIVTEPAVTPVTSPDALTVATPGADDPHVTVAATDAPFWSLGLAASCSVVPATSDVEAALTETDVSTETTCVVVPPPEHPAKASATATNERTERAEMPNLRLACMLPDREM